MRFLLDMGISSSVALWLKSLGYDTVHLNDENLYMLPDNLIIEKAIKEGRVILTSDMDFGHLLALINLNKLLLFNSEHPTLRQ